MTGQGGQSDDRRAVGESAAEHGARAVPWRASEASTTSSTVAPVSRLRVLVTGLRTVSPTDLPAAFVVVLFSAIAMAEAAAVAEVDLMGDALAARLVLVVLAVVGGAFLWLRRRRPEAPVEVRSWRWLPSVPAATLVLIWLAGRLVPEGRRVEWFLGGDHVRHLVYVVDEHATGNLSYASESYPRGWHTVVAMMWGASGGRQDGPGLASLLDLMSSATWLLYAMFALASANLAVSLSTRLGASQRASAVAGLAAGVSTLWPPFVANYQAMGFENSVLGALLLAVAAREIVRGAARTSALVVCAACTAVMAHAWQLLLPGVALTAVVAAVAALRARPPRRAAVVLVGVGSLSVAVPGMVAVVGTIGLGHAVEAGVVVPLPVWAVVVGIAAGAWLAVVRRVELEPLTVAAVVLLPALTAFGVAAAVGIPVTQYYPNKLLWHTATLGLTVAAALVAGAIARAPARVWRPARPVAGAVGVLAIAYGLVTPLGAYFGAWSTVDGPRVVRAITSPQAGEAEVVWLGQVGDDTIGRILLDFYRAGDSDLRTPQEPQSVDGECALLAASATPTVLSTHPVSAVRDRYACVPGIRVISVAP